MISKRRSTHDASTTYVDVVEVIGDHAGHELRRLAQGDAAGVVEGTEVVAAGADDEQGPAQQAVQALAAHQAGREDPRLGLGEQINSRRVIVPFPCIHP